MNASTITDLQIRAVRQSAIERDLIDLAYACDLALDPDDDAIVRWQARGEVASAVSRGLVPTPRVGED